MAPQVLMQPITLHPHVFTLLHLLSSYVLFLFPHIKFRWTSWRLHLVCFQELPTVSFTTLFLIKTDWKKYLSILFLSKSLETVQNHIMQKFYNIALSCYISCQISVKIYDKTTLLLNVRLSIWSLPGLR